MDDSLVRHTKGITPRRLLRRFIEVMEVQDTPTPIRTRRAAAKNTSAQKTRSASKRRSTRQSAGGQRMHSEVLRHQSQQSSSFMDQSLNVSAVQGVNQTYANIVAPDSDSSSLIASPDLEKTAKWNNNKKRKLGDALLPVEMAPKPPSKKKSKKEVIPPTDAGTASISKKTVSGEKGSDTTDLSAQEAQHIEPQIQTKEPSSDLKAAGDKLQIIPQKVASPKGGTEETVHLFNQSSISALSAETNGTYDFTSEDDDTHLNIVETRRRFGNQAASHKLSLPSVIELLQRKEKPTDSENVANVGDALVAPDLQAPTPVTSPPTSHEALEEPNKLNRTSQDINSDFILPPASFRDGEVSTTKSFREANFSSDLGKNTFVALIHQEESDASQDQDVPLVTPRPVQEEGTAGALQEASTGQRKSVGEVITTTTTPTRSSQRKSVGEVINTNTSPTRSSQRKSVGEVITTPTRSSQRKSVAEVITTATPTRSSQRKSVAEVITTTATPTKSSQRKSVGEVITTATPTRSSQRKSVAEVITTAVTPTRSSQRKSVGEVITTATPTRSSQRKSVAEVITTATPTKSSQRKSVAEVITTATPTRSSQRKSVAEVITTATPKSSQRKSVAEVITTTATPTKSSQRKSDKMKITSILVSPELDETDKDTDSVGSVVKDQMSEASKTGQQEQGSTAIVSVPSGAEGKEGRPLTPQREGDTHDEQQTDESPHGVSGGNERDELVFTSDDEDESPNKKRRIGTYLPGDVAEAVLPEDAFEEAPPHDGEDEFSLIPVSVKPSFHTSHKSVTTASTVDAQKRKSSLPKTKATPTPKQQPSAPMTTARVRQMTMKEFLEKLKTKPVPPPVPKPKPLLANILGTPSPSKATAKAPQRRKHKKSKELPASLPRSVTKELFTHFTKCRVTTSGIDEVVKTSEKFWRNLTRDLTAMMSARNQTEQIEAKDVEKLMKRQDLVTSSQTLNTLVEELLPQEMWKLFMPFPDPASNPFSPFTGSFFKTDKDPDTEED